MSFIEILKNIYIKELAAELLKRRDNYSECFNETYNVSNGKKSTKKIRLKNLIHLMNSS